MQQANWVDLPTKGRKGRERTFDGTYYRTARGTETILLAGSFWVEIGSPPHVTAIVDQRQRLMALRPADEEGRPVRRRQFRRQVEINVMGLGDAMHFPPVVKRRLACKVKGGLILMQLSDDEGRRCEHCGGTGVNNG